MNKLKIVDCVTLSVDCMSASEEEKTIYGVNAWGFDFYVKEKDASELMYYIISKLSEFCLPALNIHLGKKVHINENDVWTKQAIDACISNNMGFLLEAQKEGIKSLK